MLKNHLDSLVIKKTKTFGSNYEKSKIIRIFFKRNTL